VLFSLLTVCQIVIDIAGELSARRGDRFEDYTQAVRNLARDERFPAELVRRLERLPGFRNVLVHGYVALNLARVVEALDELELIERFAAIVADIEAEGRSGWRALPGEGSRPTMGSASRPRPARGDAVPGVSPSRRRSGRRYPPGGGPASWEPSTRSSRWT
jgi:uncharacterized protein YutE (UPF0331/DUF86 family)